MADPTAGVQHVEEENGNKTSSHLVKVDSEYEKPVSGTEVDTVHGDEALKILKGGASLGNGGDTWDPKEEKRLVRKIDRKLMPILCICYGIQYWDKAMLSQAVSSDVLCSCTIASSKTSNPSYVLKNIDPGTLRSPHRSRA
jgi:GMP synthase-like glutamine amidotransferase